jgi:hypothetical protein
VPRRGRAPCSTPRACPGACTWRWAPRPSAFFNWQGNCAAGIVTGSRGLNVVENLLFGSVAYKVMHLSPLPVIVVP